MKQLKFILCLVLLACLAFGNAFAADSLPYDCYNYDHWNNILYTPAPYVPDGLVSGATLRFEGAPVGAFRNPQDLCVSPYRGYRQQPNCGPGAGPEDGPADHHRL